VPMLAGVPAGSASEIHAVAAGAKGIVAIGGVCCAQEEAAAWWSADGGAWQRVAFPRPRDGGVAAVAAGDAGFVAVGTSGMDAAMWSSEDGLSWHVVRPAGADLGRGEMRHVVAIPGGFVAVGALDVKPADSDGVVLASEGLAGWQPHAGRDPTLTGADEVSLGHVVPFANGWFAAGGVGTRQERLQCEQLLGGAPTAGADLALSCGSLRDMNWRSGGIDAWERVDPWGADGTYPPDFVPPGRAAIDWGHVVAGGPGLVSVPYELEEKNMQNSGDELGVWVSANARDWQRIGAGPDLRSELLSAVIVVGRQVVVVTDKGRVIVGDVLP
jgi:hypothetical protein